MSGGMQDLQGKEEVYDKIDIAINHMRRLKPVLKIQTVALREIVDYFVDKGFFELMPVILSTVTDPLGPDPGSSVIKTGEIEYYGQKLKLTQSMILHKQMALISGVDKIFIMSPNVRFEHEKRYSTGKHAFEFTQVDFEIAHAKKEDVFSLMEDLLVRIIKRVQKDCASELKELKRDLKVPKTPFKVLTTHELVKEFGEDWEIEASKHFEDPFWAVCHKREFYDREDPEHKGHYLNYDLVYPEGFGEALSGGEREFEYDVIIRKLKERNQSTGDFKDYVELAKRGLLVPSAGAGFGVERLVRFLSGKKHIEEVQLFPRVPGKKVIF